MLNIWTLMRWCFILSILLTNIKLTKLTLILKMFPLPVFEIIEVYIAAAFFNENVV